MKSFWSLKWIDEARQISLTGPYFKFNNPYGQHATLQRDVWYVTQELPPEKCETEIQRILKGRCLGCIERFRSSKRRYIIEQSHPTITFKTLREAVAHLVEKATVGQQPDIRGIG
jgi:hypothetical protein